MSPKSKKPLNQSKEKTYLSLPRDKKRGHSTFLGDKKRGHSTFLVLFPTINPKSYKTSTHPHSILTPVSYLPPSAF
ncbi:MAG: hypothetical protein JRJ39_06640 [Deltaproteobacteria bacterium]|nr:hypothetical protein [Deltaproteobacteria bacterium]